MLLEGRNELGRKQRGGNRKENRKKALTLLPLRPLSLSGPLFSHQLPFKKKKKT